LYRGATLKQLNKNTGVQKVLELIIGSLWLVLGAYVLWYLFKAKTFQPLTLDDLALTWKLHKKQTGCTASRINTILVKNNKFIGFKCECGYNYLQKRLITQKIHPYTELNTSPRISTKISNLLETTGSLQTMGLECSNIRKI
jgi:hypothetical protein